MRILTAALALSLCSAADYPLGAYAARAAGLGTARRLSISPPPAVLVDSSESECSQCSTPIAADLVDPDALPRANVPRSIAVVSIDSDFFERFLMLHSRAITRGVARTHRTVVHSSRTAHLRSAMAGVVALICIAPVYMRSLSVVARHALHVAMQSWPVVALVTVVFAMGAMLAVAGAISAVQCSTATDGIGAGAPAIVIGVAFMAVAMCLLSHVRVFAGDTDDLAFGQWHIARSFARITERVDATGQCAVCNRTTCTQRDVFLPCGHAGHVVCLLGAMLRVSSLKCPVCSTLFHSTIL